MVKGLDDAVGILDDFRDAATSGQGIRGRAARAMCDAYASNPTAGAMISASNQPFGVGMRYGCGPYWQGPDGYQPPSEASESPAFTGGQCPGTIYTVSTIRGDDTGLFRPQVTGLVGPISSISYTREPIENEPTRTFIRMDVVAANGSFFDQLTYLHAPDSPPSTSPDVAATSGPDDCGDPPPQYIPPTPGSPPPGRDYGDPRDIGEPGSPYIITPRPPVIGPDGQPTVPVDTPTGPVDFRPDGTDPAPGGDPVIGEPVDVDGSGEVSEDPDDELTKPTLLGYRFTVRDATPQFQSVIPGTSPRIYSRVVGSLQLVLRGENGTFYSDNLQITSQEGSIVKSHPTLKIVGCVYNVLPDLAGLTLREIRGKDDDS